MPASAHQKFEFKVVESMKVSLRKHILNICNSAASLQNLTEFRGTSMLFGSGSRPRVLLRNEFSERNYNIVIFIFGPARIFYEIHRTHQ